MQNQPSSLIGQILVALGKITKPQLEEALSVQQKLPSDEKKPLGQVLLELDYVDPNDIIEAIRVQMQMRGESVSSNAIDRQARKN